MKVQSLTFDCEGCCDREEEEEGGEMKLCDICGRSLCEACRDVECSNDVENCCDGCLELVQYARSLW